MALVLTSAPSIEPVTLADIKAHLRIEGTSEDVVLSSLALTSRLHIETALGLALTAQRWMLTLDAWPASGVLYLPIRPLLSVDAVRVLPASGAAAVLHPSTYVVDTTGWRGRIVRAFGADWPCPSKAANGIEIDMTAGFGAAAGDVPAPIRQALLLLVAHWYERRDPIDIGAKETSVPAAVSNLLAPFVEKRL